MCHSYHVHTFVFETIIITLTMRKPLQCRIYTLIVEIQSKIERCVAFESLDFDFKQNQWVTNPNRIYNNIVVWLCDAYWYSIFG